VKKLDAFHVDDDIQGRAEKGDDGILRFFDESGSQIVDEATGNPIEIDTKSYSEQAFKELYPEQFAANEDARETQRAVGVAAIGAHSRENVAEINAGSREAVASINAAAKDGDGTTTNPDTGLTAKQEADLLIKNTELIMEIRGTNFADVAVEAGYFDNRGDAIKGLIARKLLDAQTGAGQ